MKMVLAIINYDDSQDVISSLMKAGFSITKLATTGGFLKAGNVTILIGLDESMGFFPSTPVQVEVGGATVFVLNVERFEKL